MSHCRGCDKLPTESNELTNRQREVATLLVRGWTYKQIANQLVIAPRTAQNHIRTIYQKLDAETQTEAMAALCKNTPLSIPAELTTRQEAVFRLLATGKHNKEIARALCVTENTVQTHLERIYAKLNVASRAQAVAQCLGEPSCC